MALRYEAHYPPKLDETTLLNRADYTDLLPLDYARELPRKRCEYEMRNDERLYCRNTVLLHEGPSSSTTYPFHALVGTSQKPRHQVDDMRRVPRITEKGGRREVSLLRRLHMPHMWQTERVSHLHESATSRAPSAASITNSAQMKLAGAIGMACPRYGRPGTVTAIHDGDVIQGEVVGPAEGFADAVADVEHAPNEGMDEDPDEEPDPWPRFLDDGVVPAPAEVHDMLHALREMHWVGYVDGLHEHGQMITVHWVAKKVHDVICALFHLHDQLRHAELTRGNIVVFVAIADATMRVLELSLQHEIQHGIGAAGIERYGVLQDGIQMVRDLHARLLAAAELALATIDAPAAADDETVEGIQSESDERGALRQEWQLSEWDKRHIPALVLAVLDALRDKYMQAHVYAEGDAASVGSHHVAKAAHAAIRALHSLTVRRAFHIDAHEDEVRQARTLADSAMELFNSAIALQAEHGDVDAVEQDELIIASVDMLKQDYLGVLSAVLVFLDDREIAL
ncbi:hypothetical protein LTS00_016646 [Friedmanniomyces endolithicus]|uniref:Uncharacterized protein n=1 Tax=Friedmanniomyces endolithicus TaxID=329885 RepID=A0AAN6JD36_9PEZI|nr:hypothetical protein LTS00_016646 [Friedmanniomyces endolithicus]KAK0319997.1 hypothetical protein LTR82_008932 [Friedmanniomyces endolithicus]